MVVETPRQSAAAPAGNPWAAGPMSPNNQALIAVPTDCGGDTARFTIRRGAAPVGRLRVDGLGTDGPARVVDLEVADASRRRGVGSFAVCFAERCVRRRGGTALRAQVPDDNVAARRLFEKLGYAIVDASESIDTFYRDRLDAVRMTIDGAPVLLGEPHDFSWLRQIGTVFAAFCNTDSGDICFGVERGGRRYFVKYAGARTMYYKGKIADAVASLKTAVRVYEDLAHPDLIRLLDHYPVGDGYAAVFEWADGSGLRPYWHFAGTALWRHPRSPVYRFRRLPLAARMKVVDQVFAFHRHVVDHGYVPIDFYEGSLLYDFDTGAVRVCDIDFYRKTPTRNDMGKMWGTKQFIAPEGRVLGAPLDEVTAVYTMGAAAFELLAAPDKDTRTVDRSFATWAASPALFEVASRAVSNDRGRRYRSLADFLAAWDAAKTDGGVSGTGRPRDGPAPRGTAIG